ncbi:MAG: hypothetical protein NT120_04450, partial [Candidatus Aenigmarchaeota archaeon]|nr:hypothetical protein [Candidatus Aenigmarchaeota archaeon]
DVKLKSTCEKQIDMKIGVNKFTALGLIVVLILVAWTFFFYNAPVTGKATGYVPETQPANQLINPAALIAQTPSPSQQIKSPVDICTEKSQNVAGQDRASYIETCTKYLNKLCFDNSGCGPFSCISNKCQ